MSFRPKLNIGFILLAVIIAGLVLWSSGPNIGILVSVFVFIDLIIAFAAIVAGFRNGSRGLQIGGALCGLIALSSAPASAEPSIGVLIMQISGGAVGVGSFFINGTRGMFD